MTQPCQFTSPASLPFPPLPEELSVPDTPDPAAASDELRRFFRTGAVLFDTGAYLLNFQPVNQPLITYDGTLRMIRGNAFGGFTASGDLYQRLTTDTPNGPVLQPPPDPRRGIPILPIKQYRLYLRVTDLPATGFFTGGRARFGFELYRFNSSNNTWAQEPGGTFRADLALRPTPAGFVNSADFFDGDVTNGAGAFAGRMSMGWVSSFFRRAAVEFDRVKDADDVDIATFQRAFLDAGWEVSFFKSNTDVQEPNGEFWSDAEMHQALLARRDSADLDSEWRFHLLAVRRISSTERGVMFDTGATDSNKVPREGAGISCNWVIPNADPWGLVKGQRFGATGNPYVRTAVHEIGHAMGLVHNTVDNGIMNATNVIASNGTAQLPFPNNIVFQFHPDDTRRLRHYPDVYVRPGGVGFGQASNTNPPIAGDAIVEPPHLQFRVMPVLEAIPLGAPVRVNVELTNTGTAPVLAPSRIGLKHGFVCGRVVDPAGTARAFTPMVICMDSEELAPLPPGEPLQDSLTLLRGGDGALFPMAGIYLIEVTAEWDSGGQTFRVTGKTHIIVTSPVDDAHAIAALRILSSPDTLPVLVVGGDHLTEGLSAIQYALANPVLRPHYAFIEAKRLAEPFYQRQADPTAAASLIDRSTVLNEAEIRKAAKLTPKLKATLNYLVKKYDCSGHTRRAVSQSGE